MGWKSWTRSYQYFEKISQYWFENTRKHYHYSKLYKLVKFGDSEKVFVERENNSQPLVFKMLIGEFYEKLLEAHINTVCGGRN